MLVLFEFEGRDFVVRATPFGKNGYHHGKVLYADPREEVIPPDPKPVMTPLAAPAVPVAPYRPNAPTGKALEKARRRAGLGNWDAPAKEFWNWLRDRHRTQGLVSALFAEYRRANGEKENADLAFMIAAAGERHGMWTITPNKNNTRFTLTVME